MKKKTSEPPVRIAHRDTREWINIDSFTTTNVWHDGWVSEACSIEITLPAWARSIRVVGNKLHHPEHLRITATVGSATVRRELLAIGHFMVDLPRAPGVTSLHATFSSSTTFVPAEVGINGDDRRNLSWIMVAVQATK